MEIFAICVITFEPIKTWTSFVVAKKMTRCGLKTAIHPLQILGNTLTWPTILLPFLYRIHTISGPHQDIDILSGNGIIIRKDILPSSLFVYTVFSIHKWPQNKMRLNVLPYISTYLFKKWRYMFTSISFGWVICFFFLSKLEF